MNARPQIAFVGDISAQIRGVTYDKTEATSAPAVGLVPILRANNITEGGLVPVDLVYVPTRRVSPKQYLAHGDVLIAASSGSLSSVGKSGAFNIPDFDGSFGAFCKVLRPNPSRVDPRYFAHYFLTSAYRQRVSLLAAGANINNLKNEHLDNLLIPLPPLDEQRRIAAILDKADALRQKRNQAIALLENLQSSLAADLAFSRHGREVSIEDVAELQIGFPFKSSGYTTKPSDVRLCRGANVLPGTLEWSDLARWSESDASTYSNYELRDRDIIVAMDRPWISSGFKIAIVSLVDLPALLVQRVARIRSKFDRNAFYLYHVLRSGEFTKHCRPTETTIPHISPKDFRSFRFMWPDEATLASYAEQSVALQGAQVTMAKVLEATDAVFASLQHRAFSGQL